VTCTCLKPVPVERATRKGAAHTDCAVCGRQIKLTLEKGRRFGVAPSNVGEPHGSPTDPLL
jgi:hypothetical protein